ncbi:hypothetical protein DTL42_19080 [Bremerella cremea]|uniref:Uncharacterized protein n=2 Tax=Bremerella cremea TaxID=1031537 RepID=A0A368KMH7_9BACT|nr:hypothetical protein DTL42_19080 [Bremerella cremea]
MIYEPSPIEQAIFQFWDLQVACATPDLALLPCYLKREVTGCGFFLEPVAGQQYLPLKSTADLEDINGQDQSGQPIIGIIAFQDDLGIKMIEGFCYTSLWPDCEFADLSLGESKSKQRTKIALGQTGVVSLSKLAERA